MSMTDSENEMKLNAPVEIAPGVTKPLGDLTREDLRACIALKRAKAAELLNGYGASTVKAARK